MNKEELSKSIEGKVTRSQDVDFERVRREIVWNELAPSSTPRVIVQVESEQDVVNAVRFARTEGLQVAVRGGGHSWVGFSLRDDTVLIDLGRLKGVVINTEARTATVQPGVTGHDLNGLLLKHDLAFPVGHCPTVSLSGYLLSGGLGWNFNSWGPACFSIEQANVVLADGSLVVATEHEHSDLLWAVRGAGSGFFGVVTEYRLKVYPAPKAITSSNYFYPLERIDEVSAWVASIAEHLPKDVELTLFCTPASAPLEEPCRASNGYVGMLSGTAFVDTPTEAEAVLSLLEECPLLPDCLASELNEPTPMDTLLERSGTLWPESHRYLADTLWSESPPEQQLATLRDYFLQAPSPKSLALCVFHTGSKAATPALPDAAFSMTATTLMLCYAIWESAHDDEANFRWHTNTIAALDDFAVGHYIGESDIVGRPERHARSFAPGNWERLQALRTTYDPDGLFCGPLPMTA